MNDYAKMITISAAFLLAFLVLSVNALPPSAQASTTVNLTMPKQVAPGNPLYKYENHVNVTQYPWGFTNYNTTGNRFSPMPTAPSTSHLLWDNIYLRYGEAFIESYIVANGLVMVETDTSKSIYPGLSYAIDENTGKIIWSVPSSLAWQEMGGILWGGNTAFNPNTGQALYTLTTRPTVYDAKLKMAWASGPIGYNWPDLTKAPTVAWQINNNGSLPSAISGYDNGRIFSVNTLTFQMVCYNATTGAILWQRLMPASNVAIDVCALGRLYCTSYAGFFCFDEATGNLLWHVQCHETSASHVAVAYGNVYFYEVRTYVWCVNAIDGHVVWKYAPIRNVPALVGGMSAIDYNATMIHEAFYSLGVAGGMVYATTMQETTYPTLLPANFPGLYYQGTYYWVNPEPVNVIAHPGQNEFVCLNANTGAVVWRVGYGWPYGANVGTASQPAYAGPNMCFPDLADGMVFGVEEPYSSHTGIGTSRPELDPLVRYPESIPKLYLSNIWYPGRIYCFGPGPVVLSLSNATAITGQPVTIRGNAVDVSPGPMQNTPAVGLPVSLSFIGSSSGSIANVVTNSQGQFSATWTPSAGGTYSIVASSQGTASYNAPAAASTVVVVSGGLSTIASIAGIAVVAVSVSMISVPLRKRKEEEGEQLEP